MSQRQLSDDGKYRRVLSNFGGSKSIQGLEDAPIDPDVGDLKALGVASLFGFAAVAAMPTGFELLGWVIAAALVGLAAVVIYVCPSDRAPLAWVGSIARFKRSPKRLTQYAEKREERTQTLTHIEDVLPLTEAVRRRDGTLVGAVQVEGRDMALAETDEWEQAARDFEDLAGAIDGGFEVYSPARIVETQELVDGYWGRETDADVKANPTLAGLVEDYRDELPEELKRRGAAVRDFYILVWVTQDEVRRADHGALAKLAELPGVGGALANIGLARRGPSDAEIRARQKSILSGRKRAAENAVSSMEGCESEPVDAEALTAILRTYWTGRRVRKSGKPIPRHTLPIVARGTDDENPASTGGY